MRGEFLVERLALSGKQLEFRRQVGLRTAGRPSLSGLSRSWEVRMATTTASAGLVPAVPLFTNAERLAIAGLVAGYSGLTREAYELDLRKSKTIAE